MKLRTSFSILCALILAALLTMPTVSSYAWDGSDNIDRLSNGQSSVFSPGYLNAAKEHAYEVIKQSYRSKGWWENLLDKINGKMSGDTGEQVNTKVIPEVKKKTSSSSRSSTTVVPVLISGPPDNALVEQVTGSLAALHGLNKGDILHEAMSDGSTIFAWSKGGKLYSQGYGEDGQKLTELPNELSLNGAYKSPILKALNNGTCLVAYGRANNTEFKILDSSGALTASSSYDSSDTLDSITALSNGGFAASWTGNKQYFTIFDPAENSFTKTIELEGIGTYGATSIAALSNGNIAATWSNSSKVYYGIYNINSGGSSIIPTAIKTNSFEQGYAKVCALSDGGFAVSWTDYPVDVYTLPEKKKYLDPCSSYAYITIFNADGGDRQDNYALSTNSTWKDGKDHDKWKYIKNNPMTCSYRTVDIVELTNGNILALYYKDYGEEGLYAQTFDKDGKAIGTTIRPFASQFKPQGNPQIKARALLDGTFVLDAGMGSGYTYHYQYTTQGTFKALTTEDIFSMPMQSYSHYVPMVTVEQLLSSSIYHDSISNSNIYGTYDLSVYDTFTGLSDSGLGQNRLSGIFKTLLANKSVLEGGIVAPLNEMAVGRLVTDTLASAVGVPSLIATESRIPDMQIALALANILKNPTAEQKAVLDAVEALLADMKNVEEKAGANPELTKAENDLLQMVATVLLAQGVPDLLKAGDIEGIKGIFRDLGASKDKIMFEYNQSIKPYYINIVKELTANLALLQLKGMISKKIIEEELKNLEPREIDRILESIRKANDKSFEMEYILQQEAKYRKEYIEPMNNVLKADMKLMLAKFTRRISKALEPKH